MLYRAPLCWHVFEAADLGSSLAEMSTISMLLSMDSMFSRDIAAIAIAMIEVKVVSLMYELSERKMVQKIK